VKWSGHLVLVLLPDGLVYGQKDGKGTSFVVNFQNVVAMDVFLPKKAFLLQIGEWLRLIPDGLFPPNGLKVTLQTRDGKTRTITKEILAPSSILRSIVAAYQQFKASRSV
jgi:hypothetical protein